MVLSYDYSNQNRWWLQTNAPPSRAILIAMEVGRCNTTSITWWRRSRAFIKATKLCHRLTTCSLLPWRPPRQQSTEQQWCNVLPLLTILMAVAVRRYYTQRITQSRRFMAFLKGAKAAIRQALTPIDSKGHHNAVISLSFKSFRRRRWCNRSGWIGNLLGVWHINGKPRTWQMHRKTYMGWLI